MTERLQQKKHKQSLSKSKAANGFPQESITLTLKKVSRMLPKMSFSSCDQIFLMHIWYVCVEGEVSYTQTHISNLHNQNKDQCCNFYKQ